MAGQLTRETVLAASLVTSFVCLGYYVLKKWRLQRIPNQWEKVGSLTKIYLFPLKSGNKIELTEAECPRFGIRKCKTDKEAFQLRDRELVIYGEKDLEFRTARTYPKLFHIDVSVHDENHFALDAPGMPTLYVTIPNRREAKEVNVKCWRKSKVSGLDCGQEAACWVSKYVYEKDSGLRLAYNDGKRPRDITKTHQPLLKYYKNLSNHATGMFSDLASIHLISQPSVDDMNKRIIDSSITSLNFRPNILIDGPDLKPYDEHDWDFIKIGEEVVFRNASEVTRCMLVTIHPETAVRNTKREPLATLEKYRKSEGPDKLSVMGLFLDVRRNGILRVGDPVYVYRLQKS